MRLLFKVFALPLLICFIVFVNVPGVLSQDAPDKFSLWRDGPHLRGANIWQRLVHPELDGIDFLGAGTAGPPYVQEDFDRLAAMGANYVNISHAGLFTERPPYELRLGVELNLDELLSMIAAADMFAVISFRTGPGRSDFTFYRDGADVWFDPAYLLESVWQEQAAQDAWVEMWRYTAARYRDNPIVVGYDLMVEPNAAAVVLDLHDPAVFYSNHRGTLLDWDPLAARITAAIREVDQETPIIVGAMGHSNAVWLPHLGITGDSRTVYAVHQYDPFPYTNDQRPGDNLSYPGVFDIDYDGLDENFDQAWLENFIRSTIGNFMQENNLPVTVNEFGVLRWAPNAAEFMDDQIAIYEDLGINYALWMFHPSWPPHQTQNDDYDFLHGPDPENHSNVDNALSDVIIGYWSRNTIRPSNFAS